VVVICWTINLATWKYYVSGFTKMNESESVTSSLLGPKVVQLVCDLVQLLIELARLTRYKARTTVTRVLECAPLYISL